MGNASLVLGGRAPTRSVFKDELRTMQPHDDDARLAPQRALLQIET